MVQQSRALPVRQDLGNLVSHSIRQMGLCDKDRPLEKVGPFSRVKALVAPKGQIILLFMGRGGHYYIEKLLLTCCLAARPQMWKSVPEG